MPERKWDGDRIVANGWGSIPCTARETLPLDNARRSDVRQSIAKADSKSVLQTCLATSVFRLKEQTTYSLCLGTTTCNIATLLCFLESSSTKSARGGRYSDSRTTLSMHTMSSAVLHRSTLVIREHHRNSLLCIRTACARSIVNAVSLLLLLRLIN